MAVIPNNLTEASSTEFTRMKVNFEELQVPVQTVEPAPTEDAEQTAISVSSLR
ncbi:hypothetical protein [Legionella geestiana]|nr:hypothetical protein [Legionella geestiana]